MEELNKTIKYLVDQYKYPVVIVDLTHKILYLNNSAKLRYEKRGKAELLNKSIFDCHSLHSQELIKNNVMKMESGINEIYLTTNDENQKVYMVAIRDENNILIGYYERFEDIQILNEKDKINKENKYSDPTLVFYGIKIAQLRK